MGLFDYGPDGSLKECMKRECNCPYFEIGDKVTAIENLSTDYDCIKKGKNYVVEEIISDETCDQIILLEQGNNYWSSKRFKRND